MCTSTSLSKSYRKSEGATPFQSVEPFSVGRSRDLFTDVKVYKSGLDLEKHWCACGFFYPLNMLES